MGDLLETLLKSGPLGVLCGALLLGLVASSTAVVYLWKRNLKLQDDLYKLAVDKVRADEKVHGTMKAMLVQLNQVIQARLLR